MCDASIYGLALLLTTHSLHPDIELPCYIEAETFMGFGIHDDLIETDQIRDVFTNLDRLILAVDPYIS